ncbi:MAG: hypothetical protein AB1443_10480 [Pseudomonadota bacterium]
MATFPPMLHPATLLLTWLVLTAGLQWLPVSWLIGLTMIVIVAALVMAVERTLNLLRRSRWLLLSLAVLYLFATPGEYLPGILGDIGLTYEGVQLGGEQVSRLLAMLASLAILHQMIGTQGLLAGLHCLLKHFPLRETTVVRLMLVLDYAEQKQKIRWQEWLSPNLRGEGSLTDGLSLAMPRFHWCDAVMALLLFGIFVAMIVGP